MKKISLLFLSFVLTISLLACSIPGKKPTSGIWYCKELNIAIDFGAIAQLLPENSWQYTDDGSTIPLRCYIDYGREIGFSKLDDHGNEVFFLSAYFYYRKDNFIIKVHHMATDDGVVVEVDDEEYTFLLTDDKIAP